MPKTYDDHGVRFLYPDNWKLEVTALPGEPVDISLQSGGSCVWSIKIVPAEFEHESSIQQIIAGLTDQIDEVEMRPIESVIGETDLTGVELDFFYLDFVVSAKILTLRLSDRGLIFVTQGETSEFDQEEIVFDAITTSLLQQLRSNLQTEV